YLRRNPNDAPDTDYTHYDTLLTKLNQFSGDYVGAEMVKTFITSTEYRERFGPTPSVVQFSAAAYSINENAGASFITVNRLGDTSAAVAVNCATSNGTATAGADYTASSGTLSFAIGETSKTFSVPIINDSLNESNETVNLTLSNVTGNAVLGTPSTAVLTIIDNDLPPTLSINDVSVSEGNSGTTSANFTVSLSAASGQTVTVNYATASGTATAGSDYQSASGTLTFSPGDTSKPITVLVNGDALNEADETFVVNLSGASNASIIDTQGAGTITNDDPVPFLSINDVSLTEGNSGTTSANFTVSLSAASGQTVTVNYATANSTATAGSDYVATSGTLTFAPGEATKTVTVTVNGDTANEPDETFFLDLSSPTNATITQSRGTATITNDDAPTIQFSLSLYSVSEGDQRVTLTVTRSGDTSGAASVGFVSSDSAGSQNCNVFNGNASSRCDYLTSIGTVQFAAGETSKTFSVPIIDDSYAEGNEAFAVDLNSAAGASIGTQSATTVMIVDNETTTGPNQIDQASFFVRQHYLDFLNREPDQSGLNFWTNQITSCETDAACVEVKRINVSASFFLSIEFQQTGYLVERVYKASYGDADGISTFPMQHHLQVPAVRFSEFLADTQQITRGVVVLQTGWEQQLENNKQAFLAEFVQRPRFTAAGAFPPLMNATDFVSKLNNNASIPLSASEVTNLAASGKTRAEMLRVVAEHPNLVNAEFNRAFVLMQYFGYLRRNPNDPQDSDYTGYDFWLTKLNQFNGNYINAEMVKAFLSSIEYRQRFGP
ncbi:MAG TPA: Calx-beta domain-containing protein, partial [Pyrinomonadaceae bacterium]|nr:Calx-beta domain-containing protein [Pyrinomonadaceae bacterium]